MKYNKAQRLMIYQTAVTIQSKDVHRSNYSCLEEAIKKCDGDHGFSHMPVEGMLEEFRKHPTASLIGLSMMAETKREW